jgi:pSer/pThr/pTyr-binding forkhead associated (FHA) protein
MSIDSNTVFLSSDLVNIHHDDDILKCTSDDTEFHHQAEKHATSASDLQSKNLYMRGEFLVVQGPNYNTAIPIKVGQRMSIGSSANADILLTDVGISRVHVYAYWENDLLYICDENSTNGTKVNGKRISSPTELNGGDKISIGLKTVIMFNEFMSDNRRLTNERREANDNLSNIERRKLPDRRNSGLDAHEMHVNPEQFVGLFSKYLRRS